MIIHLVSYKEREDSHPLIVFSSRDKHAATRIYNFFKKEYGDSIYLTEMITDKVMPLEFTRRHPDEDDHS